MGFSYQPYIALIVLVAMLPSIISTRWAIDFIQKSAAAG